MKKSHFAQTLDAVQGAVQPIFRQHGFRKRGRNYNRTCNDGIVQVVNFQMGQYPLGQKEIPGLRENLYGWFTVNLGVYLPVVAEVETGGKAKKFYLEYECHIRERLGSLSVPGKDVWWELNQPGGQLGATLMALLQEVGIPFLDQFTSYQDCLDYYQAFESLPGNLPARSALLNGIIHSSLGNFELAQEHFSLALKNAAQSASRPEFIQYIHNIRARCLPDSGSEGS